MKIRILTVIVLLAVLVSTCQEAEYEKVQLNLHGLILPGKTDESNNIVAKFIWLGGG